MKRIAPLKPIYLMTLLISLMMIASAAISAPIDISDDPIENHIQAAPPNLMFGYDDSGSMDWEFLTIEDEGKFDSHEYIFDDPGDNVYKTDDRYKSGDILNNNSRKEWLSQWSGYNKIYYNPKVTYRPWVSGRDTRLENADTVSPKSHPYGSDSHKLTLQDAFISDINLEYAGEAFTPTEVIQDNSDSGNTPSGNWGTANDVRGAYNDSLQVAVNTRWRGNSFEWQVSLDKNAEYEVFVHIPSMDSVTVGGDTIDMAEKVSYEIYHQGWRAAEKTISQYLEGGWASLGKYEFGSGKKNRVKLIQPRVKNWGDKYPQCVVAADAVKFVEIESDSLNTTKIVNAHYYAKSEADGKYYLVNLSGGKIQYYAIKDGDNYITDPEEDDGTIENSEYVNAATSPVDITSRDYNGELQNFANWYCYYRKRYSVAVAAISDVTSGIRGMKVGVYAINGSLSEPVTGLDIKDKSGNTEDNVESLLGKIQKNLPGRGSTPLRNGLKTIGQYYDQSDKDATISETSPIASNTGGGACQQNFTVLFTDGYYNQYSPGVGNADGSSGAPFQDDVENTLADVAMEYYKGDLAPGVSDMVPTSSIDKNKKQHMVTYTVGFGVTGNLNPDDYNLYNTDTSDDPKWPVLKEGEDDPKDGFSGEDKIDDLWHAAVNGRGDFYSAANPLELSEALLGVIKAIKARVGSGASVSMNGEELSNGSIMYQSSYDTEGWTGDVKAYRIVTQDGEGKKLGDVIRTEGDEVWVLSSTLRAQTWDGGRNIVTFNGAAGVTFRYDSLPDAYRLILNPEHDNDDTDKVAETTAIISYLRGDNSKEIRNGGIFRNRAVLEDGKLNSTKLGDIVHSAPYYFKGMIYVGANDGMLHAIDADTGFEEFAYIPSFVFKNLPALPSPNYSHQFYVDSTVHGASTPSGDLIVGGLGKGGKGIYCLNVTTAKSETNTEDDIVNNIVNWEYPSATTGEDDDMGYSFSKPTLVNSAAGWVVVFGNGYNSKNEKSALYVLDAASGKLLNKIVCENSGPGNGLSTPVIVDVDADEKADYVYAGDLRGYLWKFDFSDSNARNWCLAYGSSPLFQAKGDGHKEQPITSRPDVMLHKRNLPGYMVMFGTGKYLGLPDVTNNDTQSIYGIWDYGDDDDNDEYVGVFKRPGLSNPEIDKSDLLEQTDDLYAVMVQNADGDGIIETSYRVLSNNLPKWRVEEDDTEGQNPNPSSTEDNHIGWYFDLSQDKERVIQDVLIRDGVLIAITSMPSNDNGCEPGGASMLHEIDAFTGGRTEKRKDTNHDGKIDENDDPGTPDPKFDINDDGKVDGKDLVKVQVEGQDGSMETLTVAPTGTRIPSMVYPPMILRLPGDCMEIKYFSGSGGTIETIKEKCEQRGIYYWREY